MAQSLIFAIRGIPLAAYTSSHRPPGSPNAYMSAGAHLVNVVSELWVVRVVRTVEVVSDYEFFGTTCFRQNSK